MTSPEPRPWRSAGGVGLVVVCGLAALYAVHPLYEVDLFWHLKLGEVIASTGRIPSTDLFSAVAPDAAYVQFNWLWDLLAFRLVDGAGLRALRVAQAIAMGATLGGLYLWCWRRSAEPALAFALSALGLVLVEDRFQARPDALTVSFVVVVLPFWIGGMRAASAATLLSVAMIAALWANLHGGAALLMPVTLALLAFGTWVEPYSSERSAARRASSLAAAAALLGVCTSPTLVPGLLDWARAIGPQLHEGNQEWLPTYRMLDVGGGLSRYLIACAPTLVALAYVGEQRARLRAPGASARRMLGEWLLCAVLLVLAQQAIRNAFLCFVPLVFMGLRRAAVGFGRAQRAAAVSIGAVLCGLSFEDAILDSYGSLAELPRALQVDIHADDQPLALGKFVAETGVEGGVLNDGRWGGYLIFHGWPALTVLADSRHHFTPEVQRVFRASEDVLQRGVLAEGAFERWGLELTAFANPTFAAGPPSGWVLLFKSGPEELYQRAGAAHAAANLARARAWLARRGAAPADPSTESLERAMRARGGADYLAAPLQQARLARATRLSRAASPAARADAEGQLGVVYFHADRGAQALQHFARQAALDVADPRPALYAALIHAQASDVGAARADLARLRSMDLGRLSALQRQRLVGLSRQLESPVR